jgi:hypothetical protein
MKGNIHITPVMSDLDAPKGLRLEIYDFEISINNETKCRELAGTYEMIRQSFSFRIARLYTIRHHGICEWTT